MSSGTKGVIPPNNEDRSESEESRETGDDKEKSSKDTFQKHLPVKKRDLAMMNDTGQKSQWPGRQKEYIKEAKILPGVIGHGSCPNRTLAYYYYYE